MRYQEYSGLSSTFKPFYELCFFCYCAIEWYDDVYVWLTDEGNVYVWGYGILGKGPNVGQSKEPTQLPPSLFGRNEFSPDIKIIDIKCGINYLAALSSEY